MLVLSDGTPEPLGANMDRGSSGGPSPHTGTSDLLVGLVLGLILAVVALGVGMWALMGGGTMGGGMMGGPTTGSELVGLVVAVVLLVAAVLAVGRALGRRSRQAPTALPAPPAPTGLAAAAPPALATNASVAEQSSFDPSSASEVDALTLPLLDRDERLLYLEIKDSGRSALQKDLGHRDGFSRSKVTRTLDRLEAKGLVARERDGMTNRVRLTPRVGKGTP